MALTNLKDLIPKIAAKYKLGGELEAAMVCHFCDSLLKELFHERVIRKARAKYVKKGILWIAVVNSTWMQEIRMKREEILRKLEERFGKKVEDIRFMQEKI